MVRRSFLEKGFLGKRYSCKRFLGKRGFAMQFNWIFVLIAGAVIIGFFFSLINNLIHSEDVGTKVRATQEIDALLKINLASENTQKIADFGSKLSIVFFADRETTYSEYSAEGSPRTARYDFNVIFSPNQLDADELLIQTFTLDTPFRSMPVVYATNREIEYVFLNMSSHVIQTILAFVPANLTKKMIWEEEQLAFMENYPDRNYDRTVFVTDDINFDYIAGVRFDSFSRPAERLFVVVITPGPGVIASYGNISFYRYTQDEGFVLNGTSPYFDHRLMIGGVISHDRNIFENNMRKVLKRINLLSGLYDRRIRRYAGEFEQCTQLYVNVLDILTGSSGSIKSLSEDREELTYEDMSLIFAASNELKQKNSAIVGGRDCPGIY
jgi:hypothetical protein